MTDADIPAQESVNRKLPTIPMEEIGRQGKEIYERDIRPQVDPEYEGAAVAIDVDSGSWATGKEALDAADRLQERCPEAVNICLLPVGDKFRIHIGIGLLSGAKW